MKHAKKISYEYFQYVTILDTHGTFRQFTKLNSIEVELVFHVTLKFLDLIT